MAARAYTVLHDAIIRGEIAPGQRLPVGEIATSLGMSPMPVREALHRLDTVGLVEHVPHRGGRVTSLSLEDLVEVTEARLALEPLAVMHAAERRTPESTRQIEAAWARLASLSERSRRIWEAHTSFHFALYEAAGSRWLLRLITPLWESSERYRTAGKSQAIGVRHHDHEMILEAVTEGHPDLAYALMHNHLTETANRQATRLGADSVFQLMAVPGRAR